MTRLGLSTDELLSTTRAVRRRLDFERPVPESVLRECVELAVQAPTASNTQTWHFVFVTERDKVEAIAGLYRRGFEAYVRGPTLADRAAEDGRSVGGRFAGHDRTWVAQQRRVVDSAVYLAENMHRSPVLLIPCVATRSERPTDVVAEGGSVIQAAWSFMLAARERGLGTCWTTLHLAYERETADVLDIPYDKVRQFALIPVAYTHGVDFKPANRGGIEDVISWNRWSR
ncbi:MAG: nitroreductase family protein [bacterium]|nr:nitroreductase family protein [bacterium]